MKQNTFSPQPGTRDVLALLKRDIFLSLNCHAVATVQSFNATNQTVQATINYTKTYMERQNPTAKQQSPFYKPKSVSYPILMDCPVIMLSGGDGVLTFPIKKGDTCLILFNDRSIDDWWKSGQTKDLTVNRLHSFSDGIALIGLRSLANVLSEYDTDRVVLKNKNAKVALSQNKIEVSNSNRNLNDILQDLIAAIQSITVTGVTTGGGTSGPPANAATFATIATQLGQLLE